MYNNRNSFGQEPYDEQKVEAIRVRLENYSAIGSPIEYQVLMNGEEIVPRTNDVSRFTSFYDLLSDKTKTVTINEFQGESRHKKTSHFYIAQPNESAPNQLGNVDIQEHVTRQINEFKLDYMNKELEKDNKVLRDEVVKLEEKNKKLDEELTETKDDLKKLISEQSLGTQIIGTLREFMPHHAKPHVPLSGVEQENEKKPEHVEETIVLTKQDHENYKLFDQFMSRFNKVEVGQVMHTLEKLGEKKELIEEVLKFIYTKISE